MSSNRFFSRSFLPRFFPIVEAEGKVDAMEVEAVAVATTKAEAVAVVDAEAVAVRCYFTCVAFWRGTI